MFPRVFFRYSYLEQNGDWYILDATVQIMFIRLEYKGLGCWSSLHIYNENDGPHTNLGLMSQFGKWVNFWPLQNEKQIANKINALKVSFAFEYGNNCYEIRPH